MPPCVQLRPQGPPVSDFEAHYAAETKKYGLSVQVTSTLKMPTKEAVVKTLDECMWDAWEASKD